MSALGVGIIGVGVISDTYLDNLSSFPDVEVVIVGDLLADRARAQAEKYGVSASGTTEDVLAHHGVDLVVNLTIPAAHVAVSRAAIAAGKHVWTEKPLGLDLPAAAELLREAEAADLRIGCAPDTLLGPGFQAARRAIEDGIIGRPLFAQTVFQTQGPDLWHPSPAFLFAARTTSRLSSACSVRSTTLRLSARDPRRSGRSAPARTPAQPSRWRSPPPSRS